MPWDNKNDGRGIITIIIHGEIIMIITVGEVRKILTI